ncbi:MAG: hypothetical protein QOG38_1405 [Hyphomicrobiales bacterium]|jgi:hypothetical protein|nr:hypothetical protein [Hyphomicrobiales bacterium]
MKLATQTGLGTALSIAAAVLVTAQAFQAPAKPRKARDIVPVSDGMQGALTGVCQMYPAECRFNADGSVARVTGRRIVPGADRAVLRHFQTEIGSVQEPSWNGPAAMSRARSSED